MSKQDPRPEQVGQAAAIHPLPQKPGQQGIAMRVVQFSEPHTVPGAHNGSAITDRRWDKKASSSRHEIELQPWLRHFRITYYPQDPNSVPIVSLVHETKASRCEPLDQPS